VRHRAVAEERMQQAQEAALVRLQDHCEDLLQYRNRREEQLNREESMPFSHVPEMPRRRPENSQRCSEELAFELSFDGRSGYVDAVDFESQLRDGLWRVGAEESDVQHLSILLRPVTFSGLCKPDNVIARISGPPQIVRTVRGLPLQRVKVVGCRAMVFRLPGEVQHQRREAAAASIESCKSLRSTGIDLSGIDILGKACSCAYGQRSEQRPGSQDSSAHVQHAHKETCRS